jgi:hypothetical protein
LSGPRKIFPELQGVLSGAMEILHGQRIILSEPGEIFPELQKILPREREIFPLGKDEVKKGHERFFFQKSTTDGERNRATDFTVFFY